MSTGCVLNLTLARVCEHWKSAKWKTEVCIRKSRGKWDEWWTQILWKLGLCNLMQTPERRTSQSERQRAPFSGSCVSEVASARRPHSSAQCCVGVSIGTATARLIASWCTSASAPEEPEITPDVSRIPHRSVNTNISSDKPIPWPANIINTVLYKPRFELLQFIELSVLLAFVLVVKGWLMITVNWLLFEMVDLIFF